MSLVEHYELADLHRQVCVSILDSFLPHGSKGDYAVSVGISSQWYSYIRQPGSFAMPDSATAKVMSEALPAPEYYKRAFYYHLVEARRCYEDACAEIRDHVMNQLPTGQYLDCISDVFSKSWLSDNPYTVRYSLRASLELSQTLIAFLHPERYISEYLALCSVISHTCMVLDRLADGLFVAKLGVKVAENLDRSYFKTPQEYTQFEIYKFMLSQSEGLGYYYLNNVKQAKKAFELAEGRLPSHYLSGRANLLTSKLRLLAKVPRFVLGDAEALADRAIEIHTSNNEPLYIMLVEEALAQAYISYGTSNSLKRAKNLVDNALKYVEEPSTLGNLHKVMILRSAARLAFIRKELDGWKHYARGAIEIAENSGLHYEQRAIALEYSEFLDKSNTLGISAN